MSDAVLDQIVDSLRNSGTDLFPGRPELKAVRVVGHTPKSDHYIYEIVLDFDGCSERVNAKVYRQGKAGSQSSRVPPCCSSLPAAPLSGIKGFEKSASITIDFGRQRHYV